MSLNDPIADYLTRIRNATQARHSKVDIPASNILKEITRILQEEGYIYNYTVVDDQKQGIIRIYLKYDKNRQSIITSLKRVSRPGFRRYANTHNLPRVLNGLGIAILSTEKGILTEKQAKRENVGGEVLCYIW